MAKDKNIEELDLEELLQIAALPVPPGYKPQEIEEVVRFIMNKGIKSGPTLVPATQLWLEYVKWCNNNPMQRNHFYARLKEHLGHCRQDRMSGVMYLIDASGLALNDASNAALQTELRRMRKERENAKEKNLKGRRTPS